MICGLLTGLDAFYLSHTNRWWSQYLSSEFSWQERLGTSSNLAGTNAKQRYIQSRSLLFNSSPLRPQWQGDDISTRSFSGLLLAEPFAPSLSIEFQFDLCSWLHESFSFDTWFFVLPESENAVSGGVLFGGQSDKVNSSHSPYYFQPFVMVDAELNLKCSVLDDMDSVGKLETKRWYHLLLTYDWAIQRQNVYVDGVLQSTKEGAVHREWRRLSYQQVGCGYIQHHDTFPRRDPFGWYTFHGVVDSFRVWKAALSPEAANKLACGGELRESVFASMDRASDGVPWVNAVAVRCSRPAEGKYAHIDNVM